MSSVSYRYARSLALICAEDDSFYDVYEQFSSFMGFLEENKEVYEVINDDSFSASDKKVVIENIFEDDDNAMLKNFLCLLADKERMNELKVIYLDFEQMYLDHYDVTYVKVVSARALDDELRGSLEDKLKQKIGKDIVIEEEIDPDIIGGMILYINGKVIDMSVKTELTKLKRQLKESKIV